MAVVSRQHVCLVWFGFGGWLILGSQAQSAKCVSTFEEMWDHPTRNLDRIEEHFGEHHVRRLISNLSRTVVVSLYSGLGGAEARWLAKITGLFRILLNDYLTINTLYTSTNPFS